MYRTTDEGAALKLAFDSGREGFGWAVGDPDKVVACGVVQSPKAVRVYSQVSIEDVAANVIQHLRELVGLTMDVCYVERMVHYPPRPGERTNERKRTAIANDLLDLQAIAALVAGALRPAKVVYRTPFEWKGNLDTEVIERRLRKVLTPAEVALVDAIQPAGLRHNGWDATGLLCSQTGRVRFK
jgi:hypothetical protein